MTQRYGRVNIRVGFTPITSMSIGPQGPIVGAHSFNNSPQGITRGIMTCTHNLRSKKMLSIYGRFPKRKSARISSRGTLPILGFSHTHLSDVRLFPFGRTIGTKLKNVVMKRLRMPRLNGGPTSVSSRVVCGLLYQRLNFRNLIFASTLRVGNVSRGRGVYTRTLVTNGSLLLTPHGLGERLSNILGTMGDKGLSRRLVARGYHGMLACGCILKLGGGPRVRLSKLRGQLGHPRAGRLVLHLRGTTVAIPTGMGKVLPLSSGLEKAIILGVKGAPNTKLTFCGHLRGALSLAHIITHPSSVRTVEGQLLNDRHMVIIIASSSCGGCGAVLSSLPTSLPIVCIFLVPLGSVLSVRNC